MHKRWILAWLACAHCCALFSLGSRRLGQNITWDNCRRGLLVGLLISASHRRHRIDSRAHAFPTHASKYRTGNRAVPAFGLSNGALTGCSCCAGESEPSQREMACLSRWICKRRSCLRPRRAGHCRTQKTLCLCLIGEHVRRGRSVQLHTGGAAHGYMGIGSLPLARSSAKSSARQGRFATLCPSGPGGGSPC